MKRLYSQIPKPIADQIILGTEMTEGLTTDAQALGILQITALQMKTSTDALVVTDGAFNNARSAATAAYQNFHVADDALTQFIADTTNTLQPFYGRRYSTDWAQVGFVTPSIMTPRSIDERLGLSLRMINFLAANPTKEAPNQGVTAANGTTLRDAAINTRRLAYDADKDLETKGTARQAASDKLVNDMATLLGILSRILGQDDPRWFDFGLEKPGKLITPAAPTGLTATANTMTTSRGGNDSATTPVLVTWEATPFATRYRVRMRIAGLLGANYELVKSVTEPMAQVDVPANTTVEFIVQAVNGNRQSVASDAVAYQPVVHVAATTPVLSETPVAIVAPANGTNGHANGSRVAVRK